MSRCRHPKKHINDLLAAEPATEILWCGNCGALKIKTGKKATRWISSELYHVHRAYEDLVKIFREYFDLRNLIDRRKAQAKKDAFASYLPIVERLDRYMEGADIADDYYSRF